MAEWGRVCVRREAGGVCICERAMVASSFFSRMKGLLGKQFLSAAEGPRRDSGADAWDGLLIRPSSAVHTLGMAFAIDVIAMDGQGYVVGLREDLRPGRAAFFSWRTRKVLELPVGRIAYAAVVLGDRLLVAAA